MLGLLLTAAAAPHLTPDGWGKVRIGMSQPQVAKTLGATLEGEAIEDEAACVEKIAAAFPGMWFMFEEGKLTRISIGEKSTVTTPRRIGIGTRADEVRSAYAKGLQAEPHHYLDLPAEYLTYWTRPNARGVRFETDRRQVLPEARVRQNDDPALEQADQYQ